MPLDETAHYDLILQRRGHRNVFVETGTAFGETSEWASEHFAQVYTIEYHLPFFDQAKDKFSGTNVMPIFGDSVAALPDVVGMLDEHQLDAVYWLDAHNVGDDNIAPSGVCPLLKELDIILSSEGNHLIIVDDARLLGSPGWPTMGEVIDTVTGHVDVENFMAVNDFLVIEKGESVG